MSIYSIPTLLGSVFVLSLTVLELSKNVKALLNQIFALFCLSIFFWIGSYTIIYSNSDVSIANIFSKIACTSAMLAAPILYHFVVIFLDLKSEKKYVSICYVIMFIMILIYFFTDLCLAGVYKYYWGFYSRAGKYHPLFLVWFFSISVRCIYLLYCGYRKTQRLNVQAAQKIKYVFFVCFTVPFAGVDFIPKYGFEFYPFGWIFAIILCAIATYAIIRHQLMDINIVFKKGLVYSVLVAIVTAVYLIFVLAMGRIFQGLIGYQSFIVNLIAVFIIAILINPLRDRIQHFLDKRFFQGTLESLAIERQKLQQELFHKEKLAYVGQLASSVVHEIRNPLTAIETFVKYANEKRDDPEFIKKFDALVPSEIERIKKVVNNLLDLARPNKFNMQPLDITTVIDSTLELLGEQLELKKINVVKQYDSQGARVNADAEQMRQVFLNIFLNALQAMGDCDELSIRVTQIPADPNRFPQGNHPVKIRNKSVQICVKDTGKGIPKHQLEKIFTPFETSKDDGIGLGLPITQEIVRAHGGVIGVESEIEKGTTFEIELPIT